MFGVDDIILGATVAGAATSLFGMEERRKAQKSALNDEIELEQTRRKQMEYDALRSQRQLIRNSQMSAAVAASNQAQSGANYGSAAGGARGQIQGQTGVASNSIFQNLQLGEHMFDMNIKLAQDKMKAGEGQGLQSLGGSIMGAGPALGRMFGSSGQQAPRYQGGGDSGDMFS